MNLAALEQELVDFERDATLDDETNLEARARALDFARFVGEVARLHRGANGLATLKRRADALRARLVPINERLFQRMRAQISSGCWTRLELRQELDRFTRYSPGQQQVAHLGFDGLDILLDGILEARVPPEATLSQHPEMVHYEPSPARVILNLLDQVQPGHHDVFYDLGSGLGRVVILVNLLAGIPSRGIEYQPGFCSHARESAQALGLSDVAFINADVRWADLSDGTIFYLFTPFRGTLLQSVLEKLRREAQRRQIVVCTYGSCTRHAFDLPWLHAVDPTSNHDFRLAVFRSA